MSTPDPLINPPDSFAGHLDRVSDRLARLDAEADAPIAALPLLPTLPSHSDLATQHDPETCPGCLLRGVVLERDAATARLSEVLAVEAVDANERERRRPGGARPIPSKDIADELTNALVRLEHAEREAVRLTLALEAHERDHAQQLKARYNEQTRAVRRDALVQRLRDELADERRKRWLGILHSRRAMPDLLADIEALRDRTLDEGGLKVASAAVRLVRQAIARGLS